MLTMQDKGIAFSSLRTAGFEQTSVRHLPVPLTTLVGREWDVAAVCALLSRPEVRLVTLTGTGGVGKTRLALEVAEAASSDFADGICFVALAPLTDPGLVVSNIAQALNVQEQVSQPLLDSLQDHLREKQLLLLLDNFEQLVSATPVIAELLVEAPRLHVLVTSRTSLHLSGEHEFVVPPLSLPDLWNLLPPDRLTEYGAIRLFIERAQAVQSDFAMTEGNAAAVAAICHQLDGLPLAIELAAGRSKLFSPQALLPRLKSRLKLLVGGALDQPLRQQTLRKTIDWSYDLLEEDEKRLFRLLAVFVGGCTLEAAEAVCNASQESWIDVLDGVGRLVDKSLLRQETQADAEPRLLMLETIREYALERLSASGQTEAMQRRHATYFLAMAEQSDLKLSSTEQSTWRRRLVLEQDNLRAALRWTLDSQEAEMGLRLAGALLRFWRICLNRPREGRNWLEQMLVQPGAEARTVARAKALRVAGAMAYYQGDFPEAHRLLEASMMISREVGAAGKQELASALALLGHVSLLQGNSRTAKDLAGESLHISQEVGDAWSIAMALRLLGEATGELGDLIAACSFLEESAALFRMIGDRRYQMVLVDALGLVTLRQGDYDAAKAHFEETLSVARETGDEPFIANALAHLGTVALRMGEYPQVAALYQQSLALNQKQANRDGTVENLAGLAEVASRSGQPERAARLLGAVETLRKVSGITLPPLRRTGYDRTIEGIRALLDEATFKEAWAQGRTMPLEQVIALAEETKDESPDASVQQASEKQASSNLPPGALSPQPSPPLSPRRALKQQFGGLTTREREVARLVAQGKSNRAIADELVVGISTVEAHIGHIFTKLEFSSRAQIAAWAVDKRLAQVPQDGEVNRQKH
jgi:predicted ATPase/DNA-binding CsgD family transcriptional regulator/Tfp pilus assembly protein PilF